MIGKITTVLAKKEAEAYRSQGLHQEAVKLFTELLASSPNMNPEIRAALENRIHAYQSEMADVNQQRQRPLTPEEIVRIRDGWGNQATEADLLVCAQAFIQIGAHSEALTELQKLLIKGRLKKAYLNTAADSFVQLHPPETISDSIEQWTKATGQPFKAVIAMQLAMAQHMEAQEKLDHALALYRHLHRIPALATNMKRHMDDLIARRKDDTN